MEDFDYDEEFEDEVYHILKSLNHKTKKKFRTRDKKRCESCYWRKYYVDNGRYVKFSVREPYKQFCKKRANRIVRKFNGDIQMRGGNYKKLYDLWMNLD
ncbi:MAG: hypothetical protein RR313_09280 [Anaerovoracaceae bacterium]